MRIYLYTEHAELTEQLNQSMGDIYALTGTISHEEELITLIQQKNIDLLFVDEQTAVSESTLLRCPYCIVITKTLTALSYRKALELGARDCLDQPLKSHEVQSSIQKAVKVIASTHHNDRGHTHIAKVISIMGCKGGCGKSTVAVNLACLLQKEEHNVLLIDSIQRFGNIDIMLDFPDRKSMSSIPFEMENYDSYWQDIQDSIIKHSSGIHVLCAGDKHDEMLTSQKMKTIITIAKEKYDYIIIDTGTIIDELMTSILELSDQILFISTIDIAALKNLRTGLDTLKNHYLQLDKVKLIINRYDHLAELSLPELEKFLQMKITAVIPEDRSTVIRSINKGTPFILDATRSEIHAALESLGDCIAGKECARPEQLIHKAHGQGLGKLLSNLFTEK